MNVWEVDPHNWRFCIVVAIWKTLRVFPLSKITANSVSAYYSNNALEKLFARIENICCCIAPWHDVNKVLTENTPLAYLTGEARLAPTVALLARIRNATLFFALKGQYNLAQGSALGDHVPLICAL